MTLNEVMKDTTDAIREKKGTTENIAPINFAEEIKSISAGGGESGGSTLEYLDFSEWLYESWATFLIMSFIEVKGHPTLNGQSVKVIAPTNVYRTLAGELLSIRQASIDFSMPIILSAGGQVQTATVADYLIQQGATQEQLDAIPRLTKEQFYTLE